MRNEKHIRSVASAFVLFFLLTSVFSSSINLINLYREVQHLVVSKKSSGDGKSDIAFPYEEKEKEEESGFGHKQDLISFTPDALLPEQLASTTICYYTVSATTAIHTGPPLYLRHHKLLI